MKLIAAVALAATALAAQDACTKDCPGWLPCQDGIDHVDITSLIMSSCLGNLTIIFPKRLVTLFCAP